MASEGSGDEGTSVKNQYVAAIVVNLMTFAYGCEAGWPSPIFPYLSSADSPLDVPLTVSQGSIAASIICIGGLIGTPFYGFISDRYGRKRGALISAIPLIMNWVIKMSWRTSTGLVFARFLAGFAGAGPFLLAPTYCVEIASLKMRGVLGSLMVFAINIGIVTMYILGAYLKYNQIIIIMIIIPVIYFILMLYMPETPPFLVKNERYEEAAKSIAWLRGERLNSPVVNKILGTLKFELELANGKSSTINEGDALLSEKFSEKLSPCKDEDKKSSWQFFISSPPTIKAFALCFALVSVQCFTGIFAIVTYANDIFKQAGSNLSPNINSIIVGVLQFIGSLFASVFIERTGRKVLLITSCGVASICMFTMGTYLHLKQLDYDVGHLGWIPVTALSFFVSTFAMGIGPVPYLLASEIIMVQGRSVATTFMYIWVWLVSFLIALFYNQASAVLGVQVVFWGFGVVGAIGVFITVCFVPETKGKEFEEILEYFGQGKSKKSSIRNGNGDL